VSPSGAVGRLNPWSDDPAFWEAMEPALCGPERLALAQGDVAADDRRNRQVLEHRLVAVARLPA